MVGYSLRDVDRKGLDITTDWECIFLWVVEVTCPSVDRYANGGAMWNLRIS